MKNLTLSLLLSSLLGFSLIAFAGEDKVTENGINKEVKEALTDADQAKKEEGSKEEGSKEETGNKGGAAGESADIEKEATGKEGKEKEEKEEEEPDCE